MKKSLNQSTITFILNGVSVISLIFMVFSLSSYNKINHQLNKAQNERFELTYNANRFMNGSAYLTNEVRAFASTGIQEHYDNYWNEVDNLKNRDAGITVFKVINFIPVIVIVFLYACRSKSPYLVSKVCRAVHKAVSIIGKFKTFILCFIKLVVYFIV